MNDDPDHTRRWLISASGAVLSGALATRSSYAQVASPSAIKSQDLDQPPGETISPATTACAITSRRPSVAKCRQRLWRRPSCILSIPLPRTVSGSQLNPGKLAARYVDGLGGKPQA